MDGAPTLQDVEIEAQGTETDSVKVAKTEATGSDPKDFA